MRSATNAFAVSLTRRNTAMVLSTPQWSTRFCASLTATDFVRTAPMVLLRQAISQYPCMCPSASQDPLVGKVILTSKEFEALCSQCHVSNADETVQLLSDAGVVVLLNDGAVHLRPAQYLKNWMELEETTTAEPSLDEEGENSVNVGTAAEPKPTLSAEEVLCAHAEERLSRAVAHELQLRAQLGPAVLRAAERRRLVWSSALVFAGAQLAIISRLTYFDLDWDIMEPVSYFLGTGTSLAFFVLYLMRYGREHSYTEYERRFSAKRIKKFAPKDFPWNEYDAACEEVRLAKDNLSNVKRWIADN